MFKTLRWPSVCQICHAWPSTAVCTDCVTRFAQPVPRCPHCALALPLALHAQTLHALALRDPSSHDQPLHVQMCAGCQATPSALDACHTAVSYGFPWDACVARFKFRTEAGLARMLAHLMQHAPQVEPTLEAAHWVLPMPLSRARMRERGFNQAHELAKQLAPKKTQAHVLLRVGDGAHQVGASREVRQRLVQDAFWLAPQALAELKNKRVVLIDDVMTTGATLYAAARVLRTAGVAHISGLVFARAEQH